MVTHLIIAICSRFIGLQECVHDSFDNSNVFMAHWVIGLCSELSVDYTNVFVIN
jgi:hypothetical protein